MEENKLTGAEEAKETLQELATATINVDNRAAEERAKFDVILGQMVKLMPPGWGMMVCLCSDSGQVAQCYTGQKDRSHMALAAVLTHLTQCKFQLDTLQTVVPGAFDALMSTAKELHEGKRDNAIEKINSAIAKLRAGGVSPEQLQAILEKPEGGA